MGDHSSSMVMIHLTSSKPLEISQVSILATSTDLMFFNLPQVVISEDSLFSPRMPSPVSTPFSDLTRLDLPKRLDMLLTEPLCHALISQESLTPIKFNQN